MPTYTSEDLMDFQVEKIAWNNSEKDIKQKSCS